MEHARERVFGIAQIESPEAVEAVEEIAAVDGVDVLFVGPSDLSYSMGMFRQFEDPDVPHRDRARGRRREGAGKAAGIFLTAPDEVPGRAGRRVPDDRPRLRRRPHDAGPRARRVASC